MVQKCEQKQDDFENRSGLLTGIFYYYVKKYELILNLMATTCFKKVVMRATQDRKSKW